MRSACWTPKATDTLLECVILIAFRLQQWLHERIKFDVGDLTKISRENPNLVKIGQKYLALFTKT
jgi:hypothetical protein